MLKKSILFVLVHGINDTCLKLKTMQAAFESKGYRCFAPSLTPSDGSKGLEYLATRLKDRIAQESAKCQDSQGLYLVGFSMGGLIARYYLQELKGYQNVSLFFTISTPHHGSLLAYLSAQPGALQMRPDSDFLRALALSSHRLEGLPCYSYWTPFDLMIIPAASSVWAQAENIKIYSPAHPCMVKSNRVIADILDKAVAFSVARSSRNA